MQNVLNEFLINENIETALPGFPSYYEDINAFLEVIKYVSLLAIIILGIALIINKRKKKDNKILFIIWIISIIIFIISLLVRMPYWT